MWLMILGLGACLSPSGAIAQDASPPVERVPLDDESLDSSETKLYTSPQSILSDFFGRRRAGMLVNGMEDIVGITATGISPLFVLSVTSPSVYFLTEPDRRDALIFLYQPWFFIPIILMTLMVALKDTVLTFASYLKIPLDILGILFHLIGFLVGFRLIYHLLDIHVSGSGGPLSGALAIAILVMMFAFYISIWVLSNVFEVLILINPFPFVDTVLRVGRIAILVVMYIACWIHPVLGGLIALPILLLSLLTFERSLRTTLLGFRLAWDVALFRKDPIAPEQTTFTVFSSFTGSLPWMTLGRLVKAEGTWEFQYRRFLIGPRRCIEIADGPYSIARGSLFPGLMKQTDAGPQLIVRFPASYRGEEEDLAHCFSSEEVHDFRWSTMAKSTGSFLWQLTFGRFWKRVPSHECQPEERPFQDGILPDQDTPLPTTDQG
ncbi:hypothetical protein C5Y97_08760 [Blastopirellula marina]|uniref:Uncharacterized protein n=1 Tax=Blastopirellula marina TaxID=124 RepID=A0A2S8G1Z3_9BACT|nr:hypothetical protein C5Y98_08755 [Blastopirellula marina]PTL44810.1 hypothetical protein C5Y97_08760 [Blastopirellula marina]